MEVNLRLNAMLCNQLLPPPTLNVPLYICKIQPAQRFAGHLVKCPVAVALSEKGHNQSNPLPFTSVSSVSMWRSERMHHLMDACVMYVSNLVFIKWPFLIAIAI